METTPYPQGPQPYIQPKTSGMAIASLVCGIFAFCVPLLPGIIGIILGIVAIRKINSSGGAIGGKGLAIGGLVTSGIGTVIVGLLLPAMMLPALSRAKAKANRVKCVNNCIQQYKGMLSFAQDNGERMPWQQTPSGVRNHFDASLDTGISYGLSGSSGINEVPAHPNALQTAGVWGLAAVKRELQTPKILHSPCDPTRAAHNEIVQGNWARYDTKADGVSAELGGGGSYTFIRGADIQRPSSVLLVTRNWSGGNLGSGRWLGSDRDIGNGRVMEGLTYSQGQVVQMDGSSRQANNADLGGAGQITRAAHMATGGVARGKTSLNILRGAGL
jgi:hypothetical protein